ncbi:phosphoribosylformylglycinamidine synthase subunit PurQ, partial [Anaerosalibacter bizertensis]|nr:phosphoribosylformylglycinamidine synthase subunit PurQ [Anaerosalibacter bizertensis]
DREDLEEFKKYTEEENVEMTVVANVTDTDRLVMEWEGDTIVDISRKFLDTNGTEKFTKVFVEQPMEDSYLKDIPQEVEENLDDIKTAWTLNMKDLNTASQKGLVEKFDNTIGCGTVHMPLGGEYRQTPIEGMVSKIPVLEGETNTCSIMTYGFDPKLSKWSPFHGGLYAVIESVAKIVAIGGDYKKTRLTFQEYFEKLGEDERRWGKPFSAVLGAFVAQKELNIPSIGGKDSMSGTFNDLDVPPTLISFAVNVGKADKVVSPEFKKNGSFVILLPLDIDEKGMPNFEQMDRNYSRIYELIEDGKVLSASTVKIGGIGRSISEMCFGNKIGFRFNEDVDKKELFTPKYGSIILEIDKSENIKKIFEGVDFEVLGATHAGEYIEISQEKIDLDKLMAEWEEPLEDIFPIKAEAEEKDVDIRYTNGPKVNFEGRLGKPRVFIPVFPGTNCEWDTERAFKKAGGAVETFVFRNLNKEDIKYSIEEMVKFINQSQIIAIPGGFSGGDEPDGSGKFIATIFRNPYVKEATMNLLEKRDGLILGICNGFQALIKLGLLPYGEIREIDENSPTLTFNSIGSHVSTMAKTEIVSNLSPWFSNTKVGEVYTMPISHGEGRFVANEAELEKLIRNGQIATRYVDFNPNGSLLGVEAITSPDGRVLGKMGHSERIGKNVCKNIPGEKDQRIFEAGVGYFR